MNKYSIVLIVLVSIAASLMKVNTLDCFVASNVTQNLVNVVLSSGTGSPSSGTCSGLLPSARCPSDDGCYIYNNEQGSVDFGCGIKALCVEFGNCCSGEKCNCHDNYSNY
jgi:hypothetical protein